MGALASTDPVALDWAEARIMGHDPEDIPIVGGHQAGLGSRPSTYPLLNSEDWYVPTFAHHHTKRTRFVRSLIIPMIFGPIIPLKRQAPRPTGLHVLHPLRQVQDLSAMP